MKKSYAILVLAALSFAACKKNSGEGPNQEVAQGQNSKLSLKITNPSGLKTYTPDPFTETATAEELTVKTVDVFVFDDSAPFGLTYTHLDNPDITSALAIDAKTGNKKVYVGVNLSQNVVDQIKDNYASLTNGLNVSLGDLVDLVNQTPDGASSLAMFNETEPTPLTIVAVPTGSQNTISVPVTRLVAKVTVKKDENLGLTIPGGTLSDLQFTTGQTNKKLHIAPLALFKDANWDTFALGDFNLVNTATYKAVNAFNTIDGNGDGILTSRTAYMQENTSEQFRNNEVSYISVKAKFTPTTFTGIGTPVGDGTFHAVFTASGAYYFHDSIEAETFADAHNTIRLTYNQGNCYYRLYLNAAGRYDVLRNGLYVANITKINTIGTPQADQVAGAPDTPGNPDGTGVDPTNQPISPAQNTSIQATITIVPWSVNFANYEL